MREYQKIGENPDPVTPPFPTKTKMEICECQTVRLGQSRFCYHCGKAFYNTCKCCGKQLKDSFNFCPSCGDPVPKRG